MISRLSIFSANPPEKFPFRICASRIFPSSLLFPEQFLQFLGGRLFRHLFRERILLLSGIIGTGGEIIQGKIPKYPPGRLFLLAIMEDSGTDHEVLDIFPRLEQEWPGVAGIEDLVDHRGPEKIGQKSADRIPFSHPCTGERGMVRVFL